MRKQIGAIMLVAGTCIGSGMIALPMILSKLGLVSSILVMLFIWFIMYYTSLINLELNLQADKGLPLGALGKHFSGRVAELIGTVSLKLLSYSLLAVFIYGGSSVLQELLAAKLSIHLPIGTIALWYSMVVAGVLLLPIKFVDYFNRILFIGLLVVVMILMSSLAITVDWTNMPLFSAKDTDISVWAAILPVVFTSFGFQVIFHTLTNYCNKDKKMLKQAFFWGSLIPALVYILWTCTILIVVYHANPTFYTQMSEGSGDVGQLIQVLATITQGQSVQLLVWSITLLAIVTSVIGVGVGLCDSLKGMLSKNQHTAGMNHILASILTVLPAYIVVVYVPNAFITVLGFAGMILAIIAILLPIYLFWQIKKPLYYSELSKKSLVQISAVVGLTVAASELINMFV